MKCEKCGKKIQYNAYIVREGKVYCPKCDKELVGALIVKKEKLLAEIAAKRKARKEKIKRMKKKSEKTESYNPYTEETKSDE